MEIFRSRSGFFVRHSPRPCGLRRSDGQTGERGAIFQKAPAAGIFRFHEFLLGNAFPRFNKGNAQSQRIGAGILCDGINQILKNRTGQRFGRHRFDGLIQPL
jgi:hypothetical protein